MHAKDITQFNEQGERHGYWKVHHPNGKIHYISNYVNGLEYGYDIIIFSNDGKLKIYYAR